MQQEPCTVSFISPQRPQESCRDTSEDCFQSVTSFWHLWSTLKKRGAIWVHTHAKKHINLKETKKDWILYTDKHMHLKGAYWHNMLAHTPDCDTTHTLSVFFKHTHSLLLCVWVWARALCQVSAQCGTPLHVSTRWTHLCLLHTHTHTVTTPWTTGYNTLFLSQTDGIQKELYIHSSQLQMIWNDMSKKNKNNMWLSLVLIEHYTIHFKY